MAMLALFSPSTTPVRAQPHARDGALRDRPGRDHVIGVRDRVLAVVPHFVEPDPEPVGQHRERRRERFRHLRRPSVVCELLRQSSEAHVLEAQRIAVSPHEDALVHCDRRDALAQARNREGRTCHREPGTMPLQKNDLAACIGFEAAEGVGRRGRRVESTGIVEVTMFRPDASIRHISSSLRPLRGPSRSRSTRRSRRRSRNS